MKATGIVRRVDDLGRLVVPKELRNALDIKEQTPLEIFIENETIILKKYNPGCIICGEMSELKNFEDKKICKKCLERIKKVK